MAVRQGRVSGARRFTSLHALPAFGMIALALAVIANAALTAAFVVDWPWLVRNGQSFSFFVAIAWAFRWLGVGQAADAMEAMLLMAALFLLLALCSAVFVSADGPLIDDALRQADLNLFAFKREDITGWLQRHPAVRYVAGAIYLSLAYMPMIIIALLAFTRRQRLAWTLATALLVTCLVSIIGLRWFAAYGSPPYSYRFADILHGLRSGAIRRLDGDVVTGLVTFPSVHDADGLILACASTWLGRWAAPLVVVNLLMIATALAVGGHYLVDLIAGCVLGACMLWISLAVHCRLDAVIFVKNAQADTAASAATRHH